jgi:hypothetical protein
MHYIPFPPYYIFISSKISSHIFASKYSLSFYFPYIRQNSFTVSYFLRRCDPTRSRTSSFLRFLDHIQRRTTFSSTSLDEWSACRRDLYLTTHKPHNSQISKPPEGIRTHNLSRRVAADLRRRLRGHWDRHIILYSTFNTKRLYHFAYSFSIQKKLHFNSNLPQTLSFTKYLHSKRTSN